MDAPRKYRHLRSPLAIAIALAAVTLAVYGQLRGYEFLNFDDNLYVYWNPHIRAGLTWKGIVWAFTTIDYFYWQPLTWISHMLDCQWFGLRAGWHHLGNVLLHIVNSLLVFFVFRRLTGAHWRSAILAGLFALHPLRVESVAWVAERKDVLSGFWFLAALWAYTRFAERPGDGRFRVVLACMVMGLMSKPMLVTVPLLFLLLDYWPFRRVALAEKVPMVFLALVASALTAIGAKREGAMDWGSQLSLATKISNALISYVKYLGKTVWPENLAIFYPYPAAFPRWQVVGAIALLAAITAAAVWAGRRHRFLLVGWLWFVIGLVPTIGLMQVGWQGMADRFVYIPSIGLFLAVVWGGEILLREHRRTAALLAVAVLAACGMRSWMQARTWRDSVTVFEHALAVEESAVAHRYLGAALMDRGQTDAALAQFAAGSRLEPHWFIVQKDYGLALLARGDAPAAAERFEKAISSRKTYGDAFFGLAQAKLKMGRQEEARAAIEEALRVGVQPENLSDATALLAQISNRP